MSREVTSSTLKAREIISALDIRSPAEIDLEAIAYRLGAIVQEGPLVGAVGRLVRFGDYAFIRVRHDLREPGRKRFVVAHELGHLVLRHQGDILALCEDVDLRVWTQGQRPAENDANEFAAELLMAEHLFGPKCQSGDPSFSRIESLASEFQTTLTAAAIRYVQFSSQPCAVVISERGEIRWNRSSPSFPYWQLRRGKVHRYSYASDFFEGKPLPDEMRTVSATAWLPGMPRHDELSIKEHSTGMGYYNAVLTLLWIESDEVLGAGHDEEE